MKKLKNKSLKTKRDGTYLSGESEKELISRLNRIKGHIEGIKEMIRKKRCADEILIQVLAVKSALNSFATEILNNELEACIVSCMEGDEQEKFSKITKVLRILLKHS